MRVSTKNVHRLVLGFMLSALLMAFSGMISLADVVDVEWPSGSSFSTAMQYALDEARYSKDDTVYRIKVPAGSYTTNVAFDMYSNTYLDLTGVTITRTGTPAVFRFGRETDVTNISGYDGFKNITIVGGTIDADGKNNTKSKASLIRFAHSQNITLKNVTLKNAYSGHHVEFSACKNVTIDGCTFSGYYGSSTSNNEALQIEALHKDHFSSYGKYDYTTCKNITVKNCTFKNVQRGVGTHAGIVRCYMDKIKIENNTFENIPGYAIIATNYTNSSIKKNTIKNVGSGIMFRNICETYYGGKSSSKVSKINSKSVISGNKIEITDRKYKNVVYGIQLYGFKLTKTNKNGVPKGDYRVQGVTVEKNTITLKNLGYGIWLCGASKNNIKNNTVTLAVPKSCSGKSGGTAIRGQDGSGNKITGNKLNNKSKNKNKKLYRSISFANNKATGKLSNNKLSGFTK